MRAICELDQELIFIKKLIETAVIDYEIFDMVGRHIYMHYLVLRAKSNILE